MAASDIEDELVSQSLLTEITQEPFNSAGPLFLNDTDDDVPLAQLFHRFQPPNTSTFPTTIPSFKPLQFPPSQTNRLGKPNSHSLRSTPRTPLSLFHRFMPSSIFDTIATNTNNYAAIKNAGNGRPWHDTNGKELHAFVGLCLYMGLFPTPRIEDYWDRDLQGPYHRITQCMTLKRFQQLKRYLHVSDHDNDNSKEFFFNKLEPLFSEFVKTSQRLWVPSTNVSADEMMVMCYGRSSETVRMKHKPINSGYKIWALCDKGYLFDCFPHSNKCPWRHLQTFKRKFSHSSSVVAKLAESLPRTSPLCKQKERLMYCIFMDNLFSSPALFNHLRDVDIAAVGTVRSNSKGFPKSLALRNKKNVKLPWNTLGAALCADDQVLALTWIDNGPVQMLTTKHQVGTNHTIERVRKRPRLSSTNGAIVQQVFNGKPTAKLPIPTVVDDYNLFMGGVDIADQLRAVYTSHLPSRRTWLPLFYWLLDCCASNAYLLLCALDNTWLNSRRRFIQTLVWSLVNIQNQELVSVSNDTGCDTKLQATLCSKTYVTKSKAQQAFSFPPSHHHYPVKVGDDDRRKCIYCRIKGKREGIVSQNARKASFKCSDCGHFLCIDPSRNCFMLFHKEAFESYINKD